MTLAKRDASVPNNLPSVGMFPPTPNPRKNNVTHSVAKLNVKLDNKPNIEVITSVIV